jgi:hypothetical protein
VTFPFKESLLDAQPRVIVQENPHFLKKYEVQGHRYAEYDDSPPVGATEQKRLQQANGKFFYYARGIDGTMLTPLSTLAS